MKKKEILKTSKDKDVYDFTFEYYEYALYFMKALF